MAKDLETRERLRTARPRLRVLLMANAADGPALRSALLAMTELDIEVIDEKPGILSQTTGAPVDVVIFEFDGQSLPQPGAAGDKGRPVRIALTHERSPQAIREVLRAGADEVLFLPLDQEDLSRALLKISESVGDAAAHSGGKVISVVSLTGGTGVTTIASNCAIALANLAGKKTALVDLDFQSGDLAVCLNLEPERCISDLNDTGARLNSVQIESVLTRHRSGVYLLAAPKRIEESEQIAASRVGMIIGLLREMVDVVVMDIGRYISDVSVAAWERSDDLLYVIDQSIGAVRGAWRFLDLFARLELPRLQLRFVLNRWTPRHPITEKQIITTLGRPLFARIPREDSVLEQALGRGEDLWKAAPRSALTRALEEMALQLSAPVDLPKKGGLLSKLFARNGAHAGVKS